MASITINGNSYGVLQNPNALRSCVDHVSEFGKTQAFRFLRVLQQISSAAAMVLAEMGNAFASFFEKLSGKLVTAWSALTLTRLPSVTQKAAHAISSWGEVEGPEGQTSPFRGSAKRMCDLADFFASWGYAAAFITGDTGIKNMADVPDFAMNVLDAGMAGQDWSLAGECLQQIPADQAALRERFEGTKTEALLRLGKAVASVASGTLGLLVLALGGPILPAAALLVISLTSSIFAMAAHFYKETRTYETVKFFEWRDKTHQVN